LTLTRQFKLSAAMLCGTPPLLIAVNSIEKAN
jgi:hypothetical protein